MTTLTESMAFDTTYAIINQHNLLTNDHGDPFKVIVVGNSNVGKTSLIQNFINLNQVEEAKTTETVGMEMHTKTVKL